MKIILSAVLLATTSMLCFAQEKALTYPTIPPIIVSTRAPATEVEAVYLTPVPTDPFLASRIPLNSKIYIAPFKSEDQRSEVRDQRSEVRRQKSEGRRRKAESRTIHETLETTREQLV